jgi:acetate---CoA ligase (ADP-forming)
MNSFFKPKSIALVGASAKKNSVGYGILNNIVKNNYQGKIFAVNPNSEEVLGFKTFANLKSIKERVDLVIIAISADKVPLILEEMATLNLKSAIIVSSGFKEIGNLLLEEKIIEICRNNEIKIIGPNCLGLINPHHNLNASFAGAYPLEGKVAFISQSGAICTGLIDLAKSLNIGFSKFISLGNKTVIDEVDLIEYLATDKETEIIAIYTEQLQNSKKIIKACAKTKKPIIVLKGGISQAGAGASASHTGALVANTGAYQALFKQANLVEVSNISQLLNTLLIFQNNLSQNFSDLIILSNAGGPGVLAADEAEKNNLNLKVLNSKTSLDLAENLPLNASLNNPIDILGDAEADLYVKAFDILQNNEKKSAFLIIISPQSMSNILEISKKILSIKKTNTTVVFCLLANHLTREARDFLQVNKISSYMCPKEAVLSLASYYKWQENCKNISIENFKIEGVNKELVKKIINKNVTRESEVIREDLAFKILKAYQIPVVKNYLVQTKADAKKIAKKFSGDLVLKIVSPNIIHKSDVGGVKLNVSAKDISGKYLQIIKEIKEKRPQAEIEGVLISEMIKKNHLELIIGAFRDPLLGLTIIFGLGGIYVETLKDQSFGVEPLSYQQALNMIESLKINKILKGSRGQGAYNKKELALIILKIRQLMADFKEIKEIDINPLFAFPGKEKALAVDARIILK